MAFPGNIGYSFTYTLNGESCIDNPNGNSCEFTHRLLVDSSIDGENWTLFGEFNQNSGAFTVTGQEGVIDQVICQDFQTMIIMESI